MKRRAAPNRQSAGVSLFPFLAVLLCTMGALIVVLVVIARQARLQVAATAETAPDEELAAKQADLQWRISQLRQSREATKKALADKQTELSHLEEHSRRLRGQLEELASAREQLSQMAAGDERDKAKLKSELDRLQYRVAGLRGELGKLMQKAREGQQSYAVIPYRGPNETFRRPIYIECAATGVVLQPSGLTLTEQDFAIDDGMGNPLASAVRAAREYYLRNSLSGQGETGSAYPLMIVRPDGVLAYLAARKVLESLGPDFGYELVAQDWQIEYPPADPMLVLAMKQAISEGRMRQAYLASAAPGLFFNRHQVSFRTAHGGGADGGPTLSGGLRKYRSAYASGRPSGVAGGSGASGGAGRTARGSLGADDNPYLDALASDASGAAGGSSLAAQASAAPTAAVPGPRGRGAWASNPQGAVGYGGAGGIGIGSGNAGEPLAARANRSGSKGIGRAGQMPGLGPGSGVGSQGPANQRAGAAADGLAAGGLSGGIGNGGPPSARATAARAVANARGTGADLASAAPARSARPAGGPANRAAPGAVGNAPGNMTGTGNDPARQAGLAGTNANARDNGSAAGAGSASATDDNATSTGEKGTGGGSRSQGDQYAASNGPSAAGSNAPRGSSSTRAGGGGAGANSERSGQLASTSGGARGSSGGNAAKGGPASSGGTSSGAASKGGASSGGSTAVAGGSIGASMMQPGQIGMPTPMIAMGAQPATNQPAAQGRGAKRERNWANPDASTSNVPVERRIQIICDAEHLTIMPEGRGARGMKVIKLGSHTEDSLDELVSTVWDRIDSWGTAGRGMYWRPKLVMMIEPGGQQRYTELQSLMADSGFDVHGRPRTRGRAAPIRSQGSAFGGQGSAFRVQGSEHQKKG